MDIGHVQAVGYKLHIVILRLRERWEVGDGNSAYASQKHVSK